MAKILDRAKEPSSYAALAAIVGGVGYLFHINEAPAVADAVGQAGQAVASSGSPYIGIGAIVAGFLGVILPERSRQ